MPDRGLVIAVDGPSAAGKSAVARAAVRATSWRVLPEAFDRLDPRPSLEFSTSDELLATELTLLSEEGRRAREAARERARGRVVVADTGFWGPLTYTAGLVATGAADPATLRTLGARAVGPRSLPCVPDLVVYLDASVADRRARARRSRDAHPASLEARHARVARFERRFVLGPLSRLLPGRVRRLATSGSSRETADRLVALVGEAATVRDPAPPPRSVVPALVSALLTETRGARHRVRRVSRHR